MQQNNKLRNNQEMKQAIICSNYSCICLYAKHWIGRVVEKETSVFGFHWSLQYQC